MPSKRPSAPVRGSTTGRPIMVLLDVLGKRWTMRILWELRDEALSFRALRERCDNLSPTVLNERLAELRELSLVDMADEGYVLSTQGKTLGELLLPLEAWSRQWAAQLKRER
jgi:DNA-binding HxlR family transcriptional regulator